MKEESLQPWPLVIRPDDPRLPLEISLDTIHRLSLLEATAVRSVFEQLKNISVGQSPHESITERIVSQVWRQSERDALLLYCPFPSPTDYDIRLYPNAVRSYEGLYEYAVSIGYRSKVLVSDSFAGDGFLALIYRKELSEDEAHKERRRDFWRFVAALMLQLDLLKNLDLSVAVGAGIVRSEYDGSEDVADLEVLEHVQHLSCAAINHIARVAKGKAVPDHDAGGERCHYLLMETSEFPILDDLHGLIKCEDSGVTFQDQEFKGYRIEPDSSDPLDGLAPLNAPPFFIFLDLDIGGSSKATLSVPAYVAIFKQRLREKGAEIFSHSGYIIGPWSGDGFRILSVSPFGQEGGEFERFQQLTVKLLQSISGFCSEGERMPYLRAVLISGPQDCSMRQVSSGPRIGNPFLNRMDTKLYKECDAMHQKIKLKKEGDWDEVAQEWTVRPEHPSASCLLGWTHPDESTGIVAFPD